MIIPVLDIRQGVVVRAIAGRRSEYRPVVSALAESTEPGEVAAALIKATKSSIIYVADLDAIEGNVAPALAGRRISIFDRLKPVLRIWLDAGIRTMADLDPNLDRQISFVLGTETIADDSVALEILRRLGPERAILSIDLIPGRERCYEQLLHDWQHAGGRHVIWIDLAAVGTGQLVNRSTIELAIQRYPSLAHYPGGGVRNRADVDDWMRAGATGVLVASALHDGTMNCTL